MLDNSHIKYMLRTRFEYKDDKAPWYGMWDKQGKDKLTQAWCQKKENLAWAIIEGKDVRTGQIKILSSVPGHEFLNFSWIGQCRIPAGVRKISVESNIVGLMIISNKKHIKAFKTGLVEIIDKPSKFENYAATGE